MRRLLPIAAAALAGCAQTAIDLAQHSPDGYMPRVHCVLGNEAIINRLAIGGTLGFFAYAAIFAVLVRLGWRHRAYLRGEPLFAAGLVLFGAFFILCGISHGLGVVVLSLPGYYHALSWVEFAMGLASGGAVPVALSALGRVVAIATERQQVMATLKAGSAEAMLPLIEKMVADTAARVAAVKREAVARAQQIQSSHPEGE